MPKYNFDELIERKGSGCAKYDGLYDESGREDLLPLWVADMDFKTPDFIIDALKQRLEHPVFGYPVRPRSYFNVISSWVEGLHSWKVDPTHICFIPGIVKGIAFTLECLCKSTDKVIIQPPVYHPFRIVPEKHDLQVVYNPLLPVYEESGALKTYRMDFDHLRSVIDKDTKVLILSNPHNPAGICWDRETLRELAEITSKAGIIVISDEIHAEMALQGQKHIPYASVCEEAAMNSVTFMAPSKTFNIAGIVSSYCIIENEELRSRLFSHFDADEIDYPPIFSTVATEAAYTKGDQWRREMLEYVQANIDFVDDYLKANLPEIHCTRPQASFLIWLDCRGLGLSQKELVSVFEDKAHLELNDGTMFGSQGEGYMRLNVGCPRSVLARALDDLRAALKP